MKYFQYKWKLYNWIPEEFIQYKWKKYTIQMKLYNANVNNRMQMKNDIMQYYNANQTL